MRALPGRTKKLIVAFHFQNSDEAAWKCDDCRQSGLDKKRNCGWLPPNQRTTKGIVWAAPEIGIESCPKSYITGESLTVLEAFSVWKALGGGALDEYSARFVDGFCVLQERLLKKENYGE
jgi:hypothetical protein